MNHQARIQAAVAGIVALGFASMVAAQPVAAEGRHREVLRRRQGRPERLRHGASTRAPARAPRRTMTRPNGSTSTRARCEKMGGKMMAPK